MVADVKNKSVEWVDEITSWWFWHKCHEFCKWFVTGLWPNKRCMFHEYTHVYLCIYIYIYLHIYISYAYSTSHLVNFSDVLRRDLVTTKNPFDSCSALPVGDDLTWFFLLGSFTSPWRVTVDHHLLKDLAFNNSLSQQQKNLERYIPQNHNLVGRQSPFLSGPL